MTFCGLQDEDIPKIEGFTHRRLTDITPELLCQMR
jgi:hypothetical protein